jgi:hypothetical protein
MGRRAPVPDELVQVRAGFAGIDWRDGRLRVVCRLTACTLRRSTCDPCCGTSTAGQHVPGERSTLPGVDTQVYRRTSCCNATLTFVTAGSYQRTTG